MATLPFAGTTGLPARSRKEILRHPYLGARLATRHQNAAAVRTDPRPARVPNGTDDARLPASGGDLEQLMRMPRTLVRSNMYVSIGGHPVATSSSLSPHLLSAATPGG
ncbi:MAG TPA: hypothetical protein VES88_03285 [Gemmatimonadaceae bacterium]|nr:hypothetical protein [Gemmatimonadaceae bacterium]